MKVNQQIFWSLSFPTNQMPENDCFILKLVSQQVKALIRSATMDSITCFCTNLNSHFIYSRTNEVRSMPTATRTNPLSFLTDQLDELKAKGTHFKLRVLDDEQAPFCTFDGKRVINLASNNYLGFTTHPKLREAALEATRKYGVGSGAVRTIAGTMKIHMELEEKIARFKNVEACVVFQSGFTANAGTVSSFL